MKSTFMPSGVITSGGKIRAPYVSPLGGADWRDLDDSEVWVLIAQLLPRVLESSPRNLLKTAPGTARLAKPGVTSDDADGCDIPFAPSTPWFLRIPSEFQTVVFRLTRNERTHPVSGGVSQGRDKFPVSPGFERPRSLENLWLPGLLDLSRALEGFLNGIATAGVLFGWFVLKIEGDSWFTWWFNYLPGPSIFQRRTPMAKSPFDVFSMDCTWWPCGACKDPLCGPCRDPSQMKARMPNLRESNSFLGCSDTQQSPQIVVFRGTSHQGRSPTMEHGTFWEQPIFQLQLACCASSLRAPRMSDLKFRTFPSGW